MEEARNPRAETEGRNRGQMKSNGSCVVCMIATLLISLSLMSILVGPAFLAAGRQGRVPSSACPRFDRRLCIHHGRK